MAVKDRTLNVTIPKGVREGQHIRLAGQGSPGIGKGQPGDLYLEVAFAPDPLFKVEGKDVYLDLPVTPWEAALGASVKAPTPEGAVMLKIPPGSTKGRTMRLKGKGIPGNPPGDMHAVLKIETPPAEHGQGEGNLPADGARASVQPARRHGSVERCQQTPNNRRHPR